MLAGPHPRSRRPPRFVLGLQPQALHPFKGLTPPSKHCTVLAPAKGRTIGRRGGRRRIASRYLEETGGSRGGGQRCVLCSVSPFSLLLSVCCLRWRSRRTRPAASPERSPTSRKQCSPVSRFW